MRLMMTVLGVLALVSVLATPVHAQPAQQHDQAGGEARERYRVEPRRVDDGPSIDGVLNDSVWQLAAVVDTFIQQEPSEGEPATEKTEVRLLYDASQFYIGIHAYDSDPGGMVATEMRRDSDRLLDEDNFQIILDTFNDSRGGYMFVTNPLGAKLEQQVFEEGDGGRRGSGSNSNINRDWDGVWHVATRRTPDGWVAEIAIPMVTIRMADADLQTWGVNFMRNIRRKNEQVFWAPVPKAYGLTRVSLAGAMTGMTGLSRGLDLRVKPFLVAGGRRDRTAGTVRTASLNDAGLDLKYGLGAGLNLDLTLNTDFAQAEVDEEQVNLTRFGLFFPEKREFFLENSGQFNVNTNDRKAYLFFSRRIGLSGTGQPIPIIGGARLTGKADRHNLALMNIHTEGALGQPAQNFLVARYSRDVLARSKIGGLVVNKESVGNARFNRTFAVDTTLALTRSFTINSFLAKTSTPGLVDGDLAFYGRAAFRNSRWNIYGQYMDLQDNFNAEVGFVPRVGIRTTKFHIERNPRPNKYGIRLMEPMINMTYTTDQHNRLLSRRVHHMVGTRFQNGAYLNVMYNRSFERLDVPFRIQRGVTIPAGTYAFGELDLSFNSNPARRVYQRFSVSPQTFYDGTRTDVTAALGVRPISQFAAEAQYARNDIDAPWGAFVVNLATLRLDLALSPRMTVRTLSQYNSSTAQLSNSVRLNFIYRPGSDLYVVYDELTADLPGLPEVRNRQFVMKMTYLLSR
jgi:hypothetical protein